MFIRFPIKLGMTGLKLSFPRRREFNLMYRKFNVMSSCLILSLQRQIGILSKERVSNVAARFIVPSIAGLINQTATKSAEGLIKNF